ncbi:MAG: hypothetical protein AB7K09_22920 [Planctomycetota bacterium]
MDAPRIAALLRDTVGDQHLAARETARAAMAIAPAGVAEPAIENGPAGVTLVWCNGSQALVFHANADGTSVWAAAGPVTRLAQQHAAADLNGLGRWFDWLAHGGSAPPDSY